MSFLNHINIVIGRIIGDVAVGVKYRFGIVYEDRIVSECCTVSEKFRFVGRKDIIRKIADLI